MNEKAAGLLVLGCRIVIAVCAEIIHHISPEEVTEEDFGPRIHWGGDAPNTLSDD